MAKGNGMSDAEHGSRGVVFAATGKEHYLRLAVQSARSLRQHNPGLPIDLYSDKPVTDPVFDNVTIDEKAGRHTKITALATSRFDRTLFIDSDTIVLGPIGDIFDVLERFDIAMAQDQFLNNHYCSILYRKPLPAAFPQFNSGVLALRRSVQTTAFLADWKAAVADHNIGRDQPALREVLWDSNLRIATLPPEYNMMNTDLIRAKPLDDYHTAPRVIHNPHFYQHYDDFKNSPDPVTDTIGLRMGARLQILRARDHTMTAGVSTGSRASRGQRLKFTLQNLIWMLPRIPRFVQFNLSYNSKRAAAFIKRIVGK